MSGFPALRAALDSRERDLSALFAISNEIYALLRPLLDLDQLEVVASRLKDLAFYERGGIEP